MSSGMDLLSSIMTSKASSSGCGSFSCAEPALSSRSVSSSAVSTRWPRVCSESDASVSRNDSFSASSDLPLAQTEKMKLVRMIATSAATIGIFVLRNA
jgi:hypothetical protein